MKGRDEVAAAGATGGAVSVRPHGRPRRFGLLRRSLVGGRAIRLLVGLQLAAVLVIGATSAVRHHVWGELDEPAHYDYIQKIVEEGRLPRFDDPTSPEIRDITDNTYPRPSPNRGADRGLGGRSYEAMQPPLYYLAAAPAFALVPDHRDKVTAVRLFNVALLALSLWLLWQLTRRVAPPPAALPAFALALTVVLWPGFIVRAVNIGNAPLEVPLTLAFLIVLWEATRSRRWRTFAAAGVLVGLCLLTKVSLQYLVPLFLAAVAYAAWRRRTWGAAGRAVLVAVIPALVVAPWIVSNLVRFEAPMINIIGQPQLFSLREPEETPPPAPGAVAPPTPVWQQADAVEGRAGHLRRLHARLLNGLLPQEWEWHFEVGWIRWVATGALLALVFGAAAVLAAAPDRRRLAFLVLPAVTGLLVMNAVWLLTGDDAFFLRYLFPALLPMALAVGLGVHALSSRRREAVGDAARGVLVGTTAVMTIAIAAVWIYVAGSHYFKDVGGALGIPAGY